MFWIDDARIERSDLSGNNRRVLATAADNLVAPTKLVVDVLTQRLYWLDPAASRVGSAYFNGSQITTWSSQMFGTFSSLAIHNVSTRYACCGSCNNIYCKN